MTIGNGIVEFMDTVQSTINETSGVVNAIYTIANITYVDIKSGDEMFYQSPITNWTVVAKCDE